MKHPQLEKLEAEWNSNVEKIEALKVRASEADDGKLNDEDQASYDALMTRASDIKPLIEKLRADDQLVNSVAKVNAEVAVDEHKTRAVGDVPKDAKDFMFHYMRAMPGTHYQAKSEELVFRAVEQIASGDNTGLLPYTIADGIIRFVDSRRPCLESFSYAPVPPGAGWKHQVETQPVGDAVDVQGTEGTEVASDVISVSYVDVSHSTYAGVVQFTLQSETFTNPNIVGLQLAAMGRSYANKTESAVAAALRTAAATNQLGSDSTANPDVILNTIYQACDIVYDNSKSEADTIWVDRSTRRWLATLTLASGEPYFPTIGANNRMGTGANANTQEGPNIAGLKVITVNNFAADTFIVGNSQYGWVYESMYPTLEAVSPSTLTREVAIAGELGTYFRPEAFVGITDADSGATPNFGV